MLQPSICIVHAGPAHGQQWRGAQAGSFFARMDPWLDEVISDPVGVQFLGVSRCEALARECASEAAEHHESWAQLCGSLTTVVTPKAFARAAAGRSVLKITACATDALRHAVAVAGGGGKVLWALGSYVGGDTDMAAVSTALRLDNADTTQDLEALPLPYGAQCESAPSQETLEMEGSCLRHLILRVLDGRLRSKPIRVLVLELVLSNNGLELRKAFLEVLGAVCATLNVAVVLDETMTLARAYGFVTLQGTDGMSRTSLLAVDAMGLSVALNPRCIVGGKVAGIGIVWGTCREVSTLEPGRGTSTSIGFMRLKFADRVLCKLITERVDVGSIRAQVTAKLTLPNNSPVVTWGRGLILFSNVRFEMASTDSNTAGRMLPTSALAAMAVPASSSATCTSGISLGRTVRALSARITSACCPLDSDDSFRKLARIAIESDGCTGSKVELNNRLLSVSGGDRGAMEQLITVCKRRKDSDSRSYMIDVGGEVRKAFGMADRHMSLQQVSSE
jgi:hypothetical protein